ncbi:MAG: hypothetical protein AAGK32_20340 [Actinomycetota bacterium]
MGQPVTVLVKPSSRPGVVRFEINRSLTGMAGERYRAGQPIQDDRPVDELGRRLLDQDGVEAVHVNSNVITVEVDRADAEAGLREVIEDLFLYYRDGVTPEVPAGADA